MEQTTDSTASESGAPGKAGRQGTIQYYADELMTRIAEVPYDLIPQLFQYATLGGPRMPREDVLRRLCGGMVFRRASRGTSMNRRATLCGEADAVPVDRRRWAEQGRPEMDPSFRDYRYWWRPHLDCEGMFWRDAPARLIERFPALIGTDEYFRESENENWPADGDTDTGERGGSGP